MKITEENYLSLVIEYLEELKDIYLEEDEEIIALINYLQKTN